MLDLGAGAERRGGLPRRGLLDWQIVGPFDNSGRGGHDQEFEPEKAPFSAGQTFVGKLPGEPLPWRSFVHAKAPRNGFVNLGDLLQPDTDVTGYATLWIRSELAGEPTLFHSRGTMTAIITT